MTIPTSQTYGKQRTPTRVYPDLKVEITRTTQISNKQVYLQWTLRGSGSLTDGFKVKVERSGSSNGPWTVLATDLIDAYLYVDTDAPGNQLTKELSLTTINPVLYYKITVTHATGTNASAVALLEGGLDRRRKAMVRKLRRDAELKIRKGSGTEVAILKRRWFGNKCECVNSMGQSMRSKCSSCYGTGVSYGYWDPVYTFGQRSVTQLQTQTTTAGVTEINQAIITIPYIPKLDVYDVLVFPRDNKRYIVSYPGVTEIHNVVVHQIIQATEMNKAAREFNIQVDPWHEPPWF
jgi:hypothetical protein